ncbi:MAG: methylglyoxal synthase, partial [Muribaculaceae bacterium]|nr:methylglyoxal synthase [Muribaculaceae bacterium]
HRKADMIDWVKRNSDYLSKLHLVCTGTTGGLIRKAFEELGKNAQIDCMASEPMGGAAEIAAMVIRNEIDLAIFLIDDLNPQPHEADIQMLLRQCPLHNTPIACNRISADLMISSPLWSDPDYKPIEQSYIRFDRK